MPNLYLHVGTAKTGTKTLQYFLADNESSLRERGFTYFCDPKKSYYGWDGASTHSAHFPIVASFFDEIPDFISKEKYSAKRRVLNELRDDLEIEDRNVIISAEHFSSGLLSRDEQLDLKQSFGRFDVKVVFYLRPQHEMLVALHDTGVICGKRENVFFIPSHYARRASITNIEGVNDKRENEHSIQNIDPHSPYLNYWECIQPWSNVFGQENIIVRDYKSLVNGDVRIDFLSVVGMDSFEEFKFSERLNTGHELFQIEALRKVNRYLQPFGSANHDTYVYTNELRQIILNAIQPGGIGLGNILSTEDRVYIMSLFSSSNSEIEKRFFYPNSSLRNWSDFLGQSEGVPTGNFLNYELFAKIIINLAKSIHEYSHG
jgi:hypothetical protein